MDENLSIAVSAQPGTPANTLKAHSIAEQLGLAFVTDYATAAAAYYLLATDSGLLLASRANKTGRFKTVLRPDFIEGKVGYRLANDLTSHQPLARAAGIKPNYRPKVLDATAGLGTDGFILACLGCQVTLCERSAIMATLLSDALSRALAEPRTAALCGDRISLYNLSAQQFLGTTPEIFDTIYLDPMYPHRQKNSLNQESMRVIRLIVGDDHDAGELFAASYAAACRRVVVKRPKGAPLISDDSPNHVITMKNSRFDVYLKL